MSAAVVFDVETWACSETHFFEETGFRLPKESA
jgi:hypothetical protein